MKTAMRDGKLRNSIEVAIVGAGPFGLSVAAHLRARGVPFRIFGRAMSVWAERMPKGMLLKSDGFASSLYDPKSEYTLKAYCRDEQLPYADVNLPVPLETFVRYGMAFQKRYVPSLEETELVAMRRSGHGFELKLATGEILIARQVVIAVGISYFAHTPSDLAQLNSPLVSHSSDHHELDQFRGRRVAVLGGGSSATDIAALLHEAGAVTHLVARAPAIRFHGRPPARRPLKDRLWNPRTGIGPGLRQVFYASAPHLFRLMPESFRLRKVREALGPAAGWFMKERVIGRLPVHCGVRDFRATPQPNGLQLSWAEADGGVATLEVDHLIAATGYRVDLSRLAFLSPELRNSLRTTGGAPLLSRAFESSIPGLYFVGVSAANTFGPVMRFAVGAKFTARRVARALARTSQTRRRPSGKGTLSGRSDLASDAEGGTESP